MPRRGGSVKRRRGMRAIHRVFGRAGVGVADGVGAGVGVAGLAGEGAVGGNEEEGRGGDAGVGVAVGVSDGVGVAAGAGRGVSVVGAAEIISPVTASMWTSRFVPPRPTIASHAR